MVDQKKSEDDQIDRFKKLASDLGLAGEPPESLDRVMSRLDLKKKPGPEKPADKK
ncbi:hypothetical protein [Tabrizicola sp.]|uniref:hypothetical protein n=1 Tax=Tabrizicola sp. TaxID=2005166 RepID=UPI0025FB2989|nr:hypothetical protein [Tabrizicola sp.]MBY0349493.1 hypothetical protein [Tabrizicola sp.]MDK2774775.1 hypothetical protein [Tabrizicola sp.]